MPGPKWISDGSQLADPHGHGERAIKFLHLLKHPKSTAPNNAFELAPFMERIIRRVYGDTFLDDQGSIRRRIKTVFLLLPRGNRKTTLGAALALLHTFGPERVPGGQVISAALDRKQARIAFQENIGTITMEPRLLAAARLKDAKNQIEHIKSASVYEAISAEAGSSHGRTPNFVLADELHAWRGSALWDVLRTGLTKTKGSLAFAITTSGIGQTTFAFEMYQYAKRVESGEIVDPGFLPILFESPADVDWRDEENWHAVNPGLAHGFPDIDGLRQLAREAENRPMQLQAFKQLHLNVWLDGAAEPAFDMQCYDQGAEPFDLDDLEGLDCWIGVDLSSTSDLTAVVAVFPRAAEGFYVVPRFFVPEDTLRKRQERDSVPYVLWAEEGHVTATPGNVVDYSVVEQYIIDMGERFRLHEVVIDRWNATGTINRLTEQGITVARFGQGYQSMTAAVSATERTITAGVLQHGGHPVLRWCFSNVVVDQDPAGGRKFNKARSAEKIDGAVAAAMALARATAAEHGGSVYESDDRPAGFLSF
ncbi:terminase large subunit [Tardiphaga sp. vice352]|uniref:terminase large subunit n=1 Tax=unclassified Tardiphaga TaxID=2631404 RepID=UPI00116486A9|nr:MULTISPECIES: terminase TerL endonuclease subunit [unclassified Tardiphaga]QDM14587.1 terminase large subunit [Tardiphaga sp. vice278]QDM29975.1 terminase large subunit [Tardiphaga sp. vice352]